MFKENLSIDIVENVHSFLLDTLYFMRQFYRAGYKLKQTLKPVYKLTNGLYENIDDSLNGINKRKVYPINIY